MMLIITGGKLKKRKRSLRSISQCSGEQFFRQFRFTFDDIDDDDDVNDIDDDIIDDDNDIQESTAAA